MSPSKKTSKFFFKHLFATPYIEVTIFLSIFSKLGFFTTISEPTFENTSIKQILDSSHIELSLLFHWLIVIKANEDPMTAQFRVEEIALYHKIEEPITILDVVGI